MIDEPAHATVGKRLIVSIALTLFFAFIVPTPAFWLVGFGFELFGIWSDLFLIDFGIAGFVIGLVYGMFFWSARKQAIESQATIERMYDAGS